MRTDRRSFLQHTGVGLAAGGLVAAAGAITQAVVQLEHPNHTGSVSFLYWNAKTRKTYYLNSQGTLVADQSPFRTFPEGPAPTSVAAL